MAKQNKLVKKAKKKLDHVAKLVIHGFDDLTDKEQGRLFQWLKDLVVELKKANRGGYAKKFTARLMK